MVQAFEKFEEIEKLESITQKHKAWLEDYKGINHCSAEFEKHKWMWQKERRGYETYNSIINLIGRLPHRIIIEFDGDPIKAKEYLEITEKKIKEKGWGYIRSTHKGKSDYLWVEFTRALQDLEAKKFLMWIAPEGSEIDLNFASSKKIFQVLYAPHWRHSNERELVVSFNEGNKIDYDSLGIKAIKGKTVTKVNNGFVYRTFDKVTEEEVKNLIQGWNDKEDLAKKLYAVMPYFYDKARNWWLWCKNMKCWNIVDETEILVMIKNCSCADTINSKERNELLEAMKQIGREIKPKDIKTSWIQFKDDVVDIITGERFKSSPEYFVTNPIPWELHNENLEVTPIMDKIFEEWVGKDYVKTLYEIIAYSMIPDYPIHRIFCFVGAGMNGKSKFLELLRNFIGGNNCTTTELDVLMTSRFEVTRLHKKLVCQVGETNFNELKATSLLKKLSGGDLIGFEYKGKDPFEGKNYAKLIISTNNLPTTNDKTIGFYRRWMIIDFPNQFSEKKDILEDIPEEEYKSLALKCCSILKDLLKTREFAREGSVEDRMHRYEAKSNFLDKFINDYVSKEDINGYITKHDFYKKFIDWCKDNRHREMSEMAVGIEMKKKEFESSTKYFDWMYDGKGGHAKIWLGITWK